MIVTIKYLNKTYGAHAVAVLRDYLKLQPRERHGVRKYEVVKPFPTLKEYNQLKVKHFTTTVDELVNDAFSEFESLAGEMSDWYESLPDQFQQGDKGTAIEEAKDKLEELQAPTVEKEIGKVPVYYVPAVKIDSRSDRLSDSVSKLQAVVSTLEDKIGEPEPELDSDEIRELISELESAISTTEDVEFPGMYS